MAFVIGPGRNPIVAAAFAGLRAADRAEKKSSKQKAKPEVAAPAAKKPAAKKAAKKRGARRAK